MMKEEKKRRRNANTEAEKCDYLPARGEEGRVGRASGGWPGDWQLQRDRLGNVGNDAKTRLIVKIGVLIGRHKKNCIVVEKFGITRCLYSYAVHGVFTLEKQQRQRLLFIGVSVLKFFLGKEFRKWHHRILHVHDAALLLVNVGSVNDDTMQTFQRQSTWHFC